MQRYSSRMGRFYIEGHMLQAIRFGGPESPELKQALALMGQVFIVEARHVGYMDRLEYIGVSELFDELQEGDRIPEYILEGQSIAVKDEQTGESHVHYEVKAFQRAPCCSFCGAHEK